MKVNTILVPTDFSEDAKHAVSTATELAKLFGAKIVILHAYHVDIPMMSPMGGGYALPEGFYSQLRDRATQQVEAAAKEVEGQGVEASGIATPEPASLSIVAQAEKLPADLIVLGTRGLTGIKHVLLGSVAERVVRTAACPVLTVKATR